MQQIADWLKTLGLTQYAQAFADNDIDFSVLGYLTDQDLEKIGVSLGHRRKILATIAGLVGVVPAAPKLALTEGKPQDEAERRQLTVMFTDLVGSTALSTKLDPENLRSVIGTYHKCVAATVARFDGFVAKYMGDGVLIYFGYPRAHEDDPERAVRARSVESRFEAMHATDLTALVGREEETELLLRRWAMAKAGEGQVVLIASPAARSIWPMIG